MVSTLCAAGADPDLPLEPGGVPPLLVACEELHLPLARALLESGASARFSVITTRRERGLNAPLGVAAAADSLELTRLLVSLGRAKVGEGCQRTGFSPLHSAARAGSIRTAEWLLVHGAAVDQPCTGTGETALHTACAANQPGMATFLVRDGGADVDAVRKDTGKTALHTAAEGGAVEVLQALLDGCGANPNRGVGASGKGPF